MSAPKLDGWSFLIDEDMPRSTAPFLQASGYEAIDVRDVGLAGHPDAEVFAYAQAQQRTLVTADMGFANITLFPLGTHAGIVVGRFPNSVPTATLNDELVHQLQQLSGQNLEGILIIVEPGRVRVRRTPSQPLHKQVYHD